MIVSVVHTSSPLSYQYFLLRNRQLRYLVGSDFVSFVEDGRTHLLLGDFNVSPWSVFYKEMYGSVDKQDSLAGMGFENMTRRLGVHYSWCLRYLPFLCSQIDYVFWKEGQRDKDEDEIIQEL